MAKNKKSTLVLILTLFILATGCQSTEDKKVLKLAHGLDTSHPVHKAMVHMADALKEKSGGKLTIQIYPSGQLGGERENVELLQIGSLAMTKVSAAVMEGFAPKFKVIGLPYIFKSKAHSYKVFDGEIGDDMLKSAEEFWLRGLTFYDAGSRSFYTKENPIRHPDDLQGLKIRVMKSNTAVNMVKAFGGSPTPITFGELYTALQGGVVDGAENNPPSFYLSHHYEVCKYYSLNEHSTIPDILLISTHIWNSLSEQEQQWLQEAADESAQVQRKLWIESEEASLDAVREAGVEVIYPDKEPFAKMVEPLYEEYKSEEDIYNLIKRIQAAEKLVKTDTVTPSL